MANGDSFEERFTGFPRGILDEFPVTRDVGFPQFTKTKPWTDSNLMNEGTSSKFSNAPLDPDSPLNMWGNLMQQTADEVQTPTSGYRPRTPDPWSGQGGRNYWENLENRTPLDIGALRGSNWPLTTEIPDDPFERAALRTRQAARPEGGRQQGPATVVPEAMAADIAGGIWPAIKSGPELLKTLSALPPEMRTDPEVQEELARRGAGVALSFGLMNAPFGAADYAGAAALARSSQKQLAPLATIADTYHSPLQTVVENSSNKSAPASQWAATIKNSPVKGEELADNGIMPWLEEQGNQLLKKEDVVDEIKEGTPKLKIHEKTEQEPLEASGFKEIDRAGEIQDAHPNMAWEDAMAQAHEELKDTSTKETKYGPASEYENLVSPGDLQDPKLNYRETLISAPRESNELRFMNKPDYVGSHWEEPNVVAHYRTTDRNIGNENVLHGEEFQSDWHQAGRNRGYNTGQPTSFILEGNGPWVIRDNHGNMVRDYNNKNLAEFDLANANSGNWNGATRSRFLEYQQGLLRRLPDAPFKNSWHELAFKHFLKKAVDEGKDGVTWTTGQEQANRYPDTTGKRQNGMEAFYDNKMVNVANKIGKKYGTSVEQRILNKDDPEGYPETPVNYMKITPQMREAVGGKRGFSLYEDTTPESALATLTGERKRAYVSPDIGGTNMPSTQFAEPLPREHIFIPSPEAAMANFLAKSKLEQGTPKQWLAEMERAPANITAAKTGPLEKVMQTPTSRRQFLQGAARVPLVLRNMKNVADWLGSQEGLLTKQDVMQHIAGNAPKLNIIEKKGVFDDGDIQYLAERNADTLRQGLSDEHYEDAENELRKKHVGSWDDENLSERILPDDRNDLTYLNTRETLMQYNPSEKRGEFQGSHEEPNILMSYLTTDRNIGGAKTLHGEEFKSDWHDQGKNQGYTGVPLKRDLTVEQPYPGSYWIVRDKTNPDQHLGYIYPNEAKTADKALNIAKKKYENKQFVGESRAVPDAPLKNNWHEVAFDHFLQRAAKEGYDAVSWTPETQTIKTGETVPFGKGVRHLTEDIPTDFDKVLVNHASKYGKVEIKTINEPTSSGMSKQELLKAADQAYAEASKYPYKTPEKSKYMDQVWKLQRQAKELESGGDNVHFMRITPEMRGKLLRSDESLEGTLATLTNREDKVKFLLGAGKSYGEIASQLSMTRGTVAGIVNRAGLKGYTQNWQPDRLSDTQAKAREPEKELPNLNLRIKSLQTAIKYEKNETKRNSLQEDLDMLKERRDALQ